MNLSRIITATIYAIVLWGLFVFVGLLFADGIEGTLGILFLVLSIVGGLIAAVWLWKLLFKKGVFATSMQTRASYDLDHALHLNDPNVKFGQIQDWLSSIKQDESGFTGGYISLWDFAGYELGEFHELRKCRMNRNGKVIIDFTDGGILHIEGAELMYYSNSFIKIPKVESIRWITQGGKIDMVCYSSESNGFWVENNFNWKPGSLDFNLGAPPLVIWRNV